MTIRIYRTHFVQSLSTIYDTHEAESFFYLILETKHNLKPFHLALQPDLAFSENEITVWDGLLEDLKKEIPIQYLLNTAHFCGLNFQVNYNVLIPRPETEELIQWIVTNNTNRANSNHSLAILDIGTGSGCIAISLKKQLPEATITALDTSQNALEVARGNADLNAVEVTFLLQDILQTNSFPAKYDIIVSNPPYVRELEKQEIKKNVLEHEPHLALFVPDDNALLFYKKIGELALRSLTQNGQLYFEMNQYLGKETVTLLLDLGFTNVVLKQDMYGNDRMILASI